MKHKETLPVRSKTTLGRTKKKKKENKKCYWKTFCVTVASKPNNQALSFSYIA